MNTQVAVFGATNVPAFIKSAAPGNLTNAALGGGATFPVISLKGKKFTVREGDTATVLMSPTDPDVPAMNIEVVILDIGPSADKRIHAKVWYANGYEEGSKAKPDCYSNDGVAPAKDSANKQADKCALCAKNVWGSGNNGTGTACGSSKRLVVATPDALDKPMLLRAPATSLAPLDAYLQWMQKNGIQDTAHVVTKIGFDYTATQQKLTFKGLGWTQSDPTEAKNADIVAIIAGKKEAPKQESDEPFEQAKPAFAAKKPAKPAVEEDGDDDLPTTPKAAVKVEGEEKPKTATKPKPAPVAVEADADMESALDDLDFDA